MRVLEPIPFPLPCRQGVTSAVVLALGVTLPDEYSRQLLLGAVAGFFARGAFDYAMHVRWWWRRERLLKSIPPDLS